MDKEADETERAGRHLARNLTSLRHARRLTQDALAGAAGLPRSTIANLESGEANPSLVVLVEVAGALRRADRRAARRAQGAQVDPRGNRLTATWLWRRLGGTPHPPGTREYFTCLD